MKPLDLVKNYFKYLEKGDLESIGKLFSEDIIWKQPGKNQLSGTYKGKENIFSLLGRFMQVSNGTFKIENIKQEYDTFRQDFLKRQKVKTYLPISEARKNKFQIDDDFCFFGQGIQYLSFFTSQYKWLNSCF